jgi:hypothetical protein
MKKLIFLFAILILLAGGACRNSEPAVPTEKDGEQVWHNKFTTNGLNNQVELVSFKKTNGQLEGDHYILYFEAQERYLTDNLKPKGTVATVKAAYEFQKTENGWLGPDNKVYESTK